MTSNSVLDIELSHARSLWLQRQGLVPSSGAVASTSPAGVLRANGWSRTIGGVDVYFALRARHRGLDPKVIDGAVAEGSVRVVPAVRGCIYLVPGDDVPIVMALAAELSRPRTERDLEKVDLPWSEVEALTLEVVDALSSGPLDTTALRKALPADSVRSLGDKGKKVGLSSPLPVALRELEFQGRIQRRPKGGRLDTERYLWSLASPPQPGSVPAERKALVGAVVERVFRFFAPVSIKEVATWIGLPQRDVKGAVADLPLVPVRIIGRGDAWLPEEDLESARRAVSGQGEEHRVSFLAFEDNLLTFYGGPGVWANEEHHGMPIETWGRGKPTTLGQARHPTSRCVLVDGRLVGFWEFDAEAAKVIYGTFEPLSAERRAEAEEVSADLSRWIVDQLGHAHSFSLDTDKAVARRAETIRKLG